MKGLKLPSKHLKNKLRRGLKNEDLFVGLVATLVWEFGHPYIPGLVLDHEHTHGEEVR